MRNLIKDFLSTGSNSPIYLLYSLESTITTFSLSSFSLTYSISTFIFSWIKGAKRVDIETELSSIVKAHGGRHPLPSVKELKNTFENIGISNDYAVIRDPQ